MDTGGEDNPGPDQESVEVSHEGFFRTYVRSQISFKFCYKGVIISFGVYFQFVKITGMNPGASPPESTHLKEDVCYYLSLLVGIQSYPHKNSTHFSPYSIIFEYIWGESLCMCLISTKHPFTNILLSLLHCPN